MIVPPGSTIGGCLLVNAIKAEVAHRLTAAGRPPTVLTGSAVVGPIKATELFESAYEAKAAPTFARPSDDQVGDPGGAKTLDGAADVVPRFRDRQRAGAQDRRRIAALLLAEPAWRHRSLIWRTLSQGLIADWRGIAALRT